MGAIGLLNLNGERKRSYDPSPQRLPVSHAGRVSLYARLLADESNGPVRALQSLSGAFSGRGASATPTPRGYRIWPRPKIGCEEL